MAFPCLPPPAALATDRARVQTERSEANPEYALLRVPSAKHVKPLEEVVSKFYVGTEVVHAYHLVILADALIQSDLQ